MIPLRLPSTADWARNMPSIAAPWDNSSSMMFQVEGQSHNAWFARSDPGGPLARSEVGWPVPALRNAERALVQLGKAVRRRPVRVPADALAPIGSRLLPPIERPLLLTSPLPTDTANDNATPAAAEASSRRSIYRDLFFLFVLAATLVGTFYVGRLNAFQNVIVVPETWSQHSRLA